MDLKSYQQHMLNALYHGENQHQQLGMDQERLALYQAFIQGHYHSILKKMFPRIKQYMEVDWKLWGQEYYQQYPPSSHDVNDLTQRFADFLQTKADKNLVPAFLPELARYELAEFYVYKCPIPNIVDQHQALLSLNPNHELLHFNYDIATWVVQWEQQQQPLQGEPEKSESFLVIARCPQKLLCVFTKLSPLSLLIYELLKHQSIPLNSISARIDQFLGQSNVVDDESLQQELDFLGRQAVLNPIGQVQGQGHQTQ